MLARVTRVRTRQVDVVILVVYAGGEGEGCVCGDEWQAVIRREDVRATEKDKVVTSEGFRVGDVVRGVVVCACVLCALRCCKRLLSVLGVLWVLTVLQISLGDQSNYYLTTGKNELGVIMAKSEAGNTMYPISWKEFKDPVTGLTEGRKVAKPF